MSCKLRMGYDMGPNATIIPVSFIFVYHDLCVSHKLRMGYGMEPNVTIIAYFFLIMSHDLCMSYELRVGYGMSNVTIILCKFFLVRESRSLYESRTQNGERYGAKRYYNSLKFY